jgi:rhodanese-related sulfurtransferase
MSGPERAVRVAARAWVVASVVLAVSVPAGIATALLHPKAPAFSEAKMDAGAIVGAEAVRLEGALWLDARERSEFEAGRIPGSLLMNETEWDALLPGLLERWVPGMPLVVYCGSDACPAARRVRARLIRDLGLAEAEVFFLKGGLEQWNGAELER